MDWLDYRDKLHVGFNDEEKVGYFFRKIFNILYTLQRQASSCFGEKGYFNFCNITGTQIRDNFPCGLEYNIAVGELAKHTNNLGDFLAYYIAFANSFSNSEFSSWKREQFYDILRDMLQESHIPFEIITDKDGTFFFPKGAEELDNALVSQPLAWLSDYPKSHVAFVKALKEYANANKENASDIADKFRKALETFMREFFGVEKSLENCKQLYGSYLKNHGVPAEISGNFETLLQAYTNFINNFAKHQDATSQNILEYIMYQTGNIIRLLIILRQEETGSAH